MDEKIVNMFASGQVDLINLALATFHPYTLTVDEIEKLNKDATSYDDESGLWIQPQSIPHTVKEYVFYKRWASYGASGGNCWDGEAEPYEGKEPEYKVLRELLRRWGREKEYNNIMTLEKAMDYDNYEYYGNYDHYEIRYILFSDVVNYLKKHASQ
jgi:hypothetical protein